MIDSATPILSQLTRSDLIKALNELEQAYMFKHALVQDTAYQSLLKNERRVIHNAAARALQASYPDALDENAARLAEHYWLAEDWTQAANFAQRAGTNAMRVFAAREAMGHFEHALHALEKISDAPSEQWIDALLGWSDASAKFRPYADRLTQLERAEKLARAYHDKARLAQILYRIGSVYTLQGHNMRAIAPLAECFTLVQELGDERLAIVPTYFMGMATLDPDPRAAIGLYERAIELGQRYQDFDTAAVSLSAKAWAHARLGEFANARTAIAEGQALLPRVKSPMVASDVDLFTGWAFLEMGDTPHGLEFGRRGLDKARAADNMDCVCGAYLCVGFNQLSAQRLTEAQEAFREGIRQSQFSGADVFENLGNMGLALANYYSGSSETLDELEQALLRAQAMGDVYSAAMISQALGGIFLARGEFARAEIYLNDALAFYRHSQMLPSLSRALETLAQVYQAQTRTADAERAQHEATELQEILQEEKISMWTNQVSIDIAASPERVFSYLADFTRHGEWSMSVNALEKITPGPIAVGTEFKSHETIPIEFDSFARITALDAPTRIAWESTDHQVFRTVWEFEIQPHDGGAHLTQRVTFYPISEMGNEFLPIRQQQVESENLASLGRLKQILEK